MQYFATAATAATGFIGKHLVKTLPARCGTTGSLRVTMGLRPGMQC